MKRKSIIYRKLKSRNLGSTKPVSRIFGIERGKAIDRYYIEKFLEENSHFIKGTVLEIGDRRYTKQFGGERVDKSYVLSRQSSNSGVDFVADLETGEEVPAEIADCFILVQTLLCTFDVFSAAKNSLKPLKPGGVLLISVPGITQISQYDYERWGQYWSFTDQSLIKIYQRLVPEENITITTYGNVKAASAFLYGLSLDELELEDLEYRDRDYQLVITGIIKR